MHRVREHRVQEHHSATIFAGGAGTYVRSIAILVKRKLSDKGLKFVHLNLHTPTKMSADVCKKLCDCLGRDRIDLYQCETCKKIFEAPAAYHAQCGTRDKNFKSWSFCSYDHYIEFLKG